MLNRLHLRLKTLIIALVVSCILFTSTVSPAYAQTGGNVGPLWAVSTVFSTFISAIGTGAGTSLQKFTVNVLTYVIEGGVVIVGGCGNSNDCPKEFKSGAINTVSDMTLAMYSNPPASGVTYVASSLQNFGLIEPAYAQTGTGFTGLQPILPLWQSFRNLTYALFAIIFILAGFGVMFRYKLSPQAVVTIQSALPRIVIALLLVTFSYAIAGLMIDFLYVVISIGALGFAGAGTTPYGAGYLQQQFTNGGLFDTVGALFGQLGAGTITTSAVLGAIGGGMSAALAGILLGTGVAIGAAPLVIGALLVILILLLIILWVLIRLFFALLQSYIAIILLVIFAPIQIAIGVIPGFGGFGSWIKNLTAHLAVFAGVAFVFMLGFVMVHAISTNGLWQPPVLLGGGLGSPATNLVRLIIGLGILLTVHQVPNAVKTAFGVRGLGFNPLEATRGSEPVTDISGSITRYKLGTFFEGPSIKPGTPLSRVPGGWWPILHGIAKTRRWV